MVVAPSLITVAKYGFLSLVVTSAGFLIGNIVVVKHHTKPEFADSLVYNEPYSFLSEDVRSVLGPAFDGCITEPSKSFCLLADKKKLRLLRSKQPWDKLPDSTTVDPYNSTPHPIHKELLESGEIMASLKVTPILLEPSILYCLLSPFNKLYLIKKGFNPYKFQGSSRVVTVGIFEEEARVLGKEPALSAFALAGYQTSLSRQWLKVNVNSPGQFQTSHYFFKKGNFTVHAVVLFNRPKYVWITGLAPDDEGTKNLLYAKETSFENFKAGSLEVVSSPNLKISIPSAPVWFLYQIPASEIVQCLGLEMANPPSMAHPWLNPLQMKNRAGVAIQELKNLFYPRFISFWLWTETLAGWNEECDIFNKTYELNIGVSRREITGTNLTSLLSGSDYLKILLEIRLERDASDDVAMNIALDCYGLRVNIFICFEEQHSVHSYFSNERGVLYRISRSKFQLCSTEVYGQKINVPCDPASDFKWEILSQNGNESSTNN